MFYKNEKINPITNNKNLEVINRIKKEINDISDKFNIYFNRQSSESKGSF